jgi:hypothetical protein
MIGLSSFELCVNPRVEVAGIGGHVWLACQVVNSVSTLKGSVFQTRLGRCR